MRPLHIIKIGGQVIDDPQGLEDFLNSFKQLDTAKMLIHGGGKLATSLAGKLGVPQTMVEGRRITDAETLRIAVMVYAGLVNKTIVAQLQARGCQAIGLCGADGDLIRSKKRAQGEIDFGYVGDILPDGIRAGSFEQWLNEGLVPVISPITHDGTGTLLNTNADTMAAEIAKALAPHFDVTLTFCFEKKGVLLDVDNESSLVPLLDRSYYEQLRREGIISKGMIPKLDNAFSAFEKGVRQVNICEAVNVSAGNSSFTGTRLAVS